MNPERHGTRFGYRDDKCRCDACRKAIALDHNLYEMRRAANGGARLTVDKRGAVRRLQALMALGWPRRELAQRAGYTGDAFALILNSRRQRLELATDQRIKAIYNQLCMTIGPSSSSRIRAQKKGWAPPLGWDDIDNDSAPSSVGHKPFSPNDSNLFGDVDEVVVQRILGGDWRLPCTRAEKQAVVAAWSGRLRDLEELTGWKVDRYVTHEEGAA